MEPLAQWQRNIAIAEPAHLEDRRLEGGDRQRRAKALGITAGVDYDLEVTDALGAGPKRQTERSGGGRLRRSTSISSTETPTMRRRDRRRAGRRPRRGRDAVAGHYPGVPEAVERRFHVRRQHSATAGILGHWDNRLRGDDEASLMRMEDEHQDMAQLRRPRTTRPTRCIRT